MKDRAVAVAYRAVVVVVCAVAIGRLAGVGTAEVAPGVFWYFTTLSNVLALVWEAVCLGAVVRRLAVGGRRGSASVAPRLGGAVALAVTVTMLVYLLVLAPSAFVMDSGYVPFTLTDDLVHIVVPLLVVGDWVLFSAKGTLRWTDPLAWAAIPWAYVLFALVRAAVSDLPLPGGGRYPYPFMDVDALGWAAVAVNLVVLTACFEALAYAAVALDRWAGRRRAARQAGRLPVRDPATSSGSGR